MSVFPRTMVGGVSVSRMIIGSNWLLGYSHTSPAADSMIQKRYQGPEDFLPILQTYLSYGVDTLMAPIAQNSHLVRAIDYAQEKTGKKLILIDTPIMDVTDTEAARRETRALIRESRRAGCTFCFPHHSSAEKLVNKGTQTIDRLENYTYMIREEGMIPGLSAHMPELIVFSDLNEYDVESYIQIYNCMGFLMQVEIETVASIIQNAKKPVMTIKSMAAGRCSPFVGLTFNWNTIREQDMVTVGAFSPREVEEDVEISLAAIEHRFPQLEKRASPNQGQAAFGGER